MSGARLRITDAPELLEQLCYLWAEASELWDADDVAPLGYAYRHLCEVAGQEWGKTLDQPDYDRFIDAALSEERSHE